MNIFKKYRVKQFGDKFIPQKRTDLFFWSGIDIKDGYLWFSFNYQVKYCCYDSLEEAIDVVKKYKNKKNIYL